MIDRARGPLQITSIRIARTAIGSGTASIDEDALIVHVESASEGSPDPIRIRLTNIDSAVLHDDELTIVVRDGTHVTFASERAQELRDDLLTPCRALPELTRTLRALGSRRGRAGLRESASSDQQRFFAPLIEARRIAGGARDPESTIAAFDAATLSKALDTTLSAF